MAPASDNSAVPADETKVRSKTVNNRATAAAREWAWQKTQVYKIIYRKELRLFRYRIGAGKCSDLDW